MSDGFVQAERGFTFDGTVAREFDTMLAKSIPDYEGMREAVTRMARNFITPKADVVDLGASRGEAAARLIECARVARSDARRWVLVEQAESMLTQLQQRFAGTDRVWVQDLDLRHGYPDVDANLTLAVLTLQFVPIEHRRRLVSDVYEHTRRGGAFVVVEKVLGASKELDELFTWEHHKLKAEAGYTDEEITRNLLSLEGVMVPVTADWNVELLRVAGFREVDCFWRWGNFAGWVALR